MLTLTLASTGRHAWRYPRGPAVAGLTRAGAAILAMTGSYMVILTAFLADNGKNLPLADRLPTAAIAALLIAWSLRRHGGPEPAAGPAPAAGTAGPGPARCPGTASG